MIITCVHQGFELYGSDRSFIEAVTLMRGTFPHAFIEVVLPRGGPIVPFLERVASKITIEPLWVLRRKDLPRLATVGLLRMPGAIMRAHARLRASDIVYVNTSILVDYMLACRLKPDRAFIHVHEITEGMTRRLLRGFVRFSRANIIFNSKATAAAFALPAAQPSHIIYNGLSAPTAIEPKTFDGKRPLRLLVLGRFSRIKGQEVFIEALSMLPSHLRACARIVGSAFEDIDRAKNLAAAITAAGLDDRIQMLPFVADPAVHYRWADVVVVPSRLPESLGRVAIEAMAFGRPPLVSAIGGLPEVVEDGKTGWLVPPDQPAALARTLESIITNPSAWNSFPAAARSRFDTLFSEASFQAAFVAAIRGVLDDQKAVGADDTRDIAVVSGQAA